MSRFPSQLKSKILRAGAGAGKTTRLVDEFIQFYQNFLKHEQKQPRIVLTTFTRKATHELKERLLDKAMELKDEALYNYVSRESLVQISTIHGILSNFLKRNSFQLGLTSDFQFLTSQDDLVLKKSLLFEVLSEKQNLSKLLEIYSTTELLSLFEAAFEKKMMSSDFRYPSLDELRQYGKEFFEKKVSHLLLIKQKIKNETESEAWLRYLDFFTQDTLTISELSQVFGRAGKKPNFSSSKPPFSSLLHQDWDEQIKELKDLAEDPFFREESLRQLSEQHVLVNEFIHLFSERYHQKKIFDGRLSLSDLEIYSWLIVQKSPQLALEFSKEWDFWMIDEYQDTSDIQETLLKALTGESPQFVVGDPQQSIYLFRGANSQIFEQKQREFLTCGHDVEEKRVNYRSQPELLAFFNFFFGRLSSQFKPMEPDPRKEKLPAPVCDVLIDRNSDKTIPSESRLALLKINELLGCGVKASQIAVLARTNQSLEDLSNEAKKIHLPFQKVDLGGSLRRRDILDLKICLKFLLNPHDNKNLVSLLRTPWFSFPEADLLKLTAKGTNSFWEKTFSEDFYNKVSSRAQQVLEQLHEILDLYENWGVPETLKYMLTSSGFLDFSYQRDPSGTSEAHIWKWLHSVFEAERKGDFTHLKMVETAANLLESQNEPVPVLLPDRVNFMTIHASKGLQFEHVILLDMGKKPTLPRSGRWVFCEHSQFWTLDLKDAETQKWKSTPLIREQNSLQQEKEERESERLLYVALTRAKNSVTLICPEKPAKNSWASRTPLSLDLGLHKESDFFYQVRELGAEEVLTFKKEEAYLKIDQVPPLLSAFRPVSLVPQSVTSALIEKNWKNQNIKNLLGSLQKARVGTELHSLFEALKYGQNDLSKVDPDTYAFLKNLESPPLFSLIENGFVEYAFQVQFPGEIFRGQIDLWGECHGQIWIVDYKTGSTKYLHKAWDQLGIYARCLQKIHNWSGNQKINLCALYPQSREVFIQSYNNSTASLSTNLS